MNTRAKNKYKNEKQIVAFVNTILKNSRIKRWIDMFNYCTVHDTRIFIFFFSNNNKN